MTTLQKTFIILGLCLNSASPTLAQSLDVKNPAPLKPGINTATADSFVGAQYWYFFADPGTFSGSVTRTTSPGAAMKANLGAGAAFAPLLKDSVIHSADKGELTTFNGSVKTRNKVVVMVDPGPNGLVRAARDYQIQVSGAVSFGVASSVPAIVGTYTAMLNDYGLTKFKEDGTLMCSNGAQGKWTLFDADTSTYVIELPNTRLSLKLVPGRGLVDAASTDIVTFKLMH